MILVLHSISWVDGQKKYDVSIPRQKGAINIINDDIKALKRLCQEHYQSWHTQH